MSRKVVVTSGPSSTYPQRAYRNPTDALVKFLDYKHKTEWAVWEFRAEGTGYPDSEVHGRIRHYPWPDHHPPPFAIIPNIMASMRNWLKDREAVKLKRVVVVHCKAGKGRSGTIACSYLISEEGWAVKDALARFTERRMRVGFGAGVSIPSQLRYVGYVDRWAKNGKLYVERKVEIVEVQAWNLRDGVKVAIEGYIEEGRKIKTIHVFTKHEQTVVDATSQDLPASPELLSPASGTETSSIRSPISPVPSSTTSSSANPAVIYRPKSRIIVPTNDINVDLERRNRATYGLTMVTSVAHVWFNAFFEGLGPENSGNALTSGVFEIEWDAMDGLKGSKSKGTRALDRLAVVWKVVEDDEAIPKIITEPAAGEQVPQNQPADWHGEEKKEKDLGVRSKSPASNDVSRAGSLRGTRAEAKMEADVENDSQDADDDSLAGVKTHGMDGTYDDRAEEDLRHGGDDADSKLKTRSVNMVGLDRVVDVVQGLKHAKIKGMGQDDGPKG